MEVGHKEEEVTLDDEALDIIKEVIKIVERLAAIEIIVNTKVGLGVLAFIATEIIMQVVVIIIIGVNIIAAVIFYFADS